MSFSILVSSGYMPRSGLGVGLLGYMVVLILVFLKESPYCLP